MKELNGHSNDVSSVVFSPDGKTLASASWDKSVRLWDIATGMELKQLDGHISSVLSVVYSPDGKTLASCSLDGSVLLWDVTSGQIRWSFVSGVPGTWVSCQSTGKCWRYDDGTLVKQRNGSALSPILPPKEAGQLLEIIINNDILQVEEGKTQEFTLTLQNHGQGRVFWVNVEHNIVRDKNNKSPLIFHPPETTVILEPNKTVKVPVKVSASANYAHPHGCIYPLELKITTAHGKPQLVKIPVQTHTPSLELLEAVVKKQENKPSLLVSLQNIGKQALTETVFRGKLADISLDEVTRKMVKVGEQFNLSFALPENIKLNKEIRLTLTAKKILYPIHEWTFPDQPITIPPPPWYLYAVLTVLIFVLLVLIYYWRVFRHPLVVAVSQSQEGLYDVPLEQLPVAQRLLQWAKRWETVLSHQQIPPSRWQTALDFYHSKGEDVRCQVLVKRLELRHQTSEVLAPWLFVLNMSDDFILRIERCVLAFPPVHLPTDEIATALRQIPSTQANICVIISTDIEQYAQLIQLQRELGQGAMMWVVPDSKDLTRLLLSASAQTQLEFARLIASQVKITRISPYQTYGGVKKASMFFGREQLLADILNREPRNYLLLGARQLGKTSLLQELQRRYQQQPDIQCFYLSVSRADLSHSLRRLASALDLPENTELPMVLERLAQPPQGQSYILLIDEADEFIHAEAKNHYATLHTFRNLSEEGRCFFILAGFWELYHAASLDYQSPVKNFGETLRVGALEWEACRYLATKPMTALKIRYTNTELVEHIIEQTGRRANLIAIVCHEILQHLENRRMIAADDVKHALDSDEIRSSLGGWGNLTGENTTQSHLDRIIVYGTIELGQFSLKELWQQLDTLDLSYQPTQVNESLTRLELAFILKRKKDQYRYRVPLFCHLLKTQGACKMLKDELEWFKRESERRVRSTHHLIK